MLYLSDVSDVASAATSGRGSCTADFMGPDEVPGDHGLGAQTEQAARRLVKCNSDHFKA